MSHYWAKLEEIFVYWEDVFFLIYIIFKFCVISSHLFFFKIYIDTLEEYEKRKNNNLRVEFWWNCGTVELQQIRKWHLPIQIGTIAVKARPLLACAAAASRSHR